MHSLPLSSITFKFCKFYIASPLQLYWMKCWNLNSIDFSENEHHHLPQDSIKLIIEGIWKACQLEDRDDEIISENFNVDEAEEKDEEETKDKAEEEAKEDTGKETKEEVKEVDETKSISMKKFKLVFNNSSKITPKIEDDYLSKYGEEWSFKIIFK